jgi:hypothetical protein
MQARAVPAWEVPASIKSVRRGLRGSIRSVEMITDLVYDYNTVILDNREGHVETNHQLFDRLLGLEGLPLVHQVAHIPHQRVMPFDDRL